MFVNINQPDAHNLESSFNLSGTARPEITNPGSAFARFGYIAWINGNSLTIQLAKYPLRHKQVVRKPIKLLCEVLPETLLTMRPVASQLGEIDLFWYYHV